MGYYPYEQECIHGHRWSAAFCSVAPMSDTGQKQCPECGCYKVRTVWGIPGNCYMAHSGKQEGADMNYDFPKKLLDWDPNEKGDETLGG